MNGDLPEVGAQAVSSGGPSKRSSRSPSGA